MFSRLPFIFITLFWVTMNVLLWRSEFSHQEIASSIPAARVWEKVLTAPDNSSLEILHHKKKIGYCRWSPRVGQEAAERAFDEDFQPEGMVAEPNNYILELEGNIALKNLTNNVRFDLTLQLSTNQNWQEFKLRISMRPDSWELSANASNQTVRLLVNDEHGIWEQTYKMADLQDPEILIRELGGPFAVGLIGTLGMRPNEKKLFTPTLGLHWEAHNHLMRFGHSQVRVYRLEARLLDRFKIFVFVSRVGEILWVELPDEMVLSNDAFTHF